MKTNTITNMPLSPFTHLAFLINWILDSHPPTDLTFTQIHAAAHQSRLLDLLAHHYGHIADFSLLQSSSLLNLERFEAALSDAASALEGRETGTTRIQNSGLCLAMAIVLQAIGLIRPIPHLTKSD